MTDAPALFLGQSFEGAPERLLLNRANRHGVVAGGTRPRRACRSSAPM